MEPGSGGEANAPLTNMSLQHTYEVNPTLFVPRTENPATVQSVTESSKNMTRSLFNSTSKPLNDIVEDDAPLQVVPKNVTFIAVDGSEYMSTQEMNASYARDTTLPNPTESNSVILIVGVTCGVIGLLVGILLTVGAWIYMHKKKRNAKSLNRSSHASVHKKNPKEMTFEPLDLSLTLPTYTQGSNTLDKRKSLSNVLNNSGMQQENSSSRPAIEPHNLFYQRYPPPSPPVNNHSMFHENEGQPSEVGDDQEHTKASVQKYGRDGNIIETHKRPTSISTRDSFSSGLGTGTESDIFPCDNRGLNSGKLAADIPSLSYDLPAMDKSSYNRFEKRHRNHKALGVVRESTGRKSKRSIKGNHKKRLTQKSDTSSSYASSGTTSIHEWSSTDVSSSPSSTLPSTDQSLLPHSSTTLPMTKEKSSQINDNREEWSSGESTDKEDVAGWDKHDRYEADEMESITDNNDAVVSSYFDMHFPSTSLVSDDSETKIPDKICKSPVHANPKIRKITVIRRDSDVIDL